MRRGKFLVWPVVAAAAVAGCGGPGPSANPSSPPASSAERSQATPSPAAMTVVQFDPQWLAVDAPPSWSEYDRVVTAKFQRFGLRPAGETELPRNCNGCGVNPPTVFLTAYAAGAFDPAQARTGEPVTVSAGVDGFFRVSQGGEDAMLAWQYADGAWATVRGRTSLTSQLARLTDVAHSLRPTDRSPIRLPLSIPGLPEALPLAEINVDRGGYGTTLDFAACGQTDIGATPACARTGDSLRVQIWPTDGYSGHIDEQKSQPVLIGGREGRYEPEQNRAAVQVQPGTLAVFELSGPTAGHLDGILDTVVWAADPGDQQSWMPVDEWTARR